MQLSIQQDGSSLISTFMEAEFSKSICVKFGFKSFEILRDDVTRYYVVGAEGYFY